MAGFNLFKGGNKHREHIRIRTESVEETMLGGLEKSSSVEVNAIDSGPGKDLWVGLKIRQSQKVEGLVVDDKTWIGNGSKKDATATRQFNKVLTPSDPDETWVAYRVDSNLKPSGSTFATTLKLDKIFAKFPDAQTVSIAICYVPDAGELLKPRAVLLGYSVIQAPPPDTKAKKKGRARRK